MLYHNLPKVNLHLKGHEVEVRPAKSRAELEEAYRLVYSSYLNRGYIEQNPAKIRVTLFNVLPQSITFVGLLRNTVVGTVTVVPDTPLGLPMDEVYHDELRELRDAGRKMAEVTMLADRRGQILRALPMLLLLMKLVFDYAMLVLNVDDLCITINPRHERYYRRYLLFRNLGGLKAYPSVQHNPALAKRLDLKNVRKECEGNEELLGRFFRNRTARSVFEAKHRLSPEDLKHFFVDLTPAFREAPRKSIEYVQAQYPGYPWNEWASDA